jgi:hypothetical protein
LSVEWVGYKNFGGGSSLQKQNGRLRTRWKENTKIYYQERGCEEGRWMNRLRVVYKSNHLYAVSLGFYISMQLIRQITSLEMR